MNKPLISIIITVYNAEKHLTKCLDSVINQTYKNLEIIIVDDGSTDKSDEICDEYANNDPRIKLLHKKNGGISSARNAGLAIVSGDYIAWVDSDDYVAPDYIEYMYKLLSEHDADISSCEKIEFICSLKEEIDPNNILSNSNNNLTNQYKNEKKEPRVINNKKDIMKNYIYNLNITDTFWGKLFKKDLFNKITVIGDSFDDAYTIYKVLAKCNKFIIGEEIKYYYRFLETSLSHKFNIKWLERIDCLVKQKEYIEINFPELYDYSCGKIIDISNFVIRRLITSNNNTSIFLNSIFKNVKAKAFFKKQYKENLFQYLKYINDPITDKILAVFAYISIPITVKIYRMRFHNDFWIIKIKKLLGII